MTEDHLISLIVRRLSGRLDPEGVRGLEDWADKAAANRELLEQWMNEEKVEGELAKYRAIDPRRGYRQWQVHNRARHRVRQIRTATLAIAASLLAALVINGLIKPSGAAESSKPDLVESKKLVLPGRNTAMLTLSDGRRIQLDSVLSGDFGTEGKAEIIKPDNKSLRYRAVSGMAPAKVAYNVLTTPRSGQYKLTLADGSRVWLNNVSSLRFPTAFEGMERVVELTGEGYFEISHDPAKPFRVKVGSETVEVLGTSFNVMAYPDEGGIQTTLVSGAVRVRAGGSLVQLKPDEQARINVNGGLSVLQGVNSEDIVSWKNGFFYFGRASFAAVMRQLARWYDIEVIYEGKVPEMEFGGKIDRGLTLQELLQYLDKSHVHFRLEGRKLIVLSN